MDWDALRHTMALAGRRTKWLSFTHDVLPAGAAGVGTYVVTLLTAPAGTSVDRAALGFPLLAAFGATVGVLALTSAISFARAMTMVRRGLRIERDARSQAATGDASRDVVMKAWLRSHIANRKLRVRFAGLFGSVTRSYKTRDVDIVIQIEPVGDSRIRRVGKHLRDLRRTFEDNFGVLLHVQLFTSAETAELLDFATRAGSVEVIRGETYWDGIFTVKT